MPKKGGRKKHSRNNKGTTTYILFFLFTLSTLALVSVVTSKNYGELSIDPETGRLSPQSNEVIFNY